MTPGVSFVRCFFLLRDAGTQENDIDVIAEFFPDEKAGRHHRGNHGSHVRNKLRIVFFNQVIGSGAAGRDDVFHLSFLQQLFILGRDESRSFAGLTEIFKAQLLQRAPDLADRAAFHKSHEGRRHRDNDPSPAPDHFPDFRKFRRKTFCLLRADLQALSAEDAVVFHDFGPFVLDLNGLYEAVPHALVAVLAFRGFEVDDAHAVSLPRISLLKNASVVSGRREKIFPSTVTQTALTQFPVQKDPSRLTLSVRWFSAMSSCSLSMIFRDPSCSRRFRCKS
jgi:hypothetical protein